MYLNFSQRTVEFMRAIHRQLILNLKLSRLIKEKHLFYLYITSNLPIVSCTSVLCEHVCVDIFMNGCLNVFIQKNQRSSDLHVLLIWYGTETHQKQEPRSITGLQNRSTLTQKSLGSFKKNVGALAAWLSGQSIGLWIEGYQV